MFTIGSGFYGRGRRDVVPQRVADALPVSTEANSCQFKAERRLSNSCFSYRVERDGREALEGRKKKSIHLRSLMADCCKSIGRKSIAQLCDCFTCHRSVRALRGFSLDAANRDERRFCQQSRNVQRSIEPPGGK